MGSLLNGLSENLHRLLAVCNSSLVPFLRDLRLSAPLVSCRSKNGIQRTIERLRDVSQLISVSNVKRGGWPRRRDDARGGTRA